MFRPEGLMAENLNRPGKKIGNQFKLNFKVRNKVK